MDIVDILARELFMADGMPEKFREAWAGFRDETKAFHVRDARKILAALDKADIVVVPEMALAHGYHTDGEGNLKYKGAPAFSTEASGGI